MRRQVGHVTITTIVEQNLHDLHGLIPEATPECVREIAWLAPHFASEAGEMRGVIQAFIVEAPNRLIVVDTCVGDGKDRLAVQAWNRAQTGFLDRFRAAGFDPEAVDTVLCTHLHLDHVGWNTYWTGASWAPTFPKARYLFADVELARWKAEQAGEAPDLQQISDPLEAALAAFDLDQRQTYVDSIQPILTAGLADVVKTDHRLCEEVSLIATPGHTPGHVSVQIRSDDEQAIITGDCIHHPCQIARPGWTTLVDDDPETGAVTRRGLLDRLAMEGGLLMGSHFAEPTAGRVVADGAGFRFVTDQP